MPYGSLAALKAQLAITGTDQDTALTALLAEVSLWLDAATGRAFGVAPADATYTVWPAASRRSTGWGWGWATDVLVLPVPLRSITSVSVGGTWDGTDWADPTDLDDADWWPVDVSLDGTVHSISLGGWWSAPVVVVGKPAQAVGGATVPADVAAAVVTTAAREHRARKANTDGVLGPDGFAIQAPKSIPNPAWDRVVAKYAALAEVVI